MLTGCANFQIKDDANSMATAYLAGKGMGLTINKLAPRIDADLSNEWRAMMASNTGAIVPGTAIVQFYNRTALLMTGNVDDPYGLLADLSVLLTLYGAQYAPDKKLVFVQDAPRAVLEYFELGYSGGKRLALK